MKDERDMKTDHRLNLQYFKHPNLIDIYIFYFYF